jgi:NADH-quinone oxidoreductase subunit A
VTSTRLWCVSQAHSWVVVAAVAAGGVLFFIVAMLANWALRPRIPSFEKLTTYESGVDPIGQGWSQIQVRYYLYAYLYVIFAVDAVYLFPWATVLAAFGTAAVVEMGIFIGVLTLGLVHFWRRGALQWS